VFVVSGNNIDQTLSRLFVAETREQLEKFTQILVDVDNEPNRIETEVHELFRIAHNIKGSSGMMGLSNVKEVMHRVENHFDEIRQGKAGLSSEMIDVLLRLSDDLLSYIEAESWQNPWNSQQWLELLGFESQGKAGLANAQPKQALEFNEEQAKTLESWQSAGKKLYRVDLKFRQDAVMKTVSVFTWKKHAEQWCSTFAVIPAMDDPALEQADGVVLILQSETGLDEQTLGKISGYPVFDLEKVQIESWEYRPKPAKPVPPSGERAPAAADQTIRVDSVKIDRLINYIGELLTVKAGFNDLIERQEQSKAVWNQLTKLVQQFEQITSDFQLALMELRMVPLNQIFARFPRIIRDISKRLNKPVEIEFFGEDTEIDKQISEKLVDPLTHLIRNAMDHGIESPEKRQVSGKPSTGKIRLGASQEGDYIVISISDDGNGIDLDKVRQKAVKNKLIDPSAQLSKEEIIRLIFAPGFSTAEKVSDISGRGVGLDVVETSIRSLKGEIEVDSELGKGTTFRLKVPLTLAIIQAFLVKSCGQTMAIPSVNVLESYAIRTEDIQNVGGNDVFSLRQEFVPLFYLNRLFGMEDDCSQVSGPLSLVILNRGRNKLGLVVDELVGQAEIMIKQINKALPDNPLVSGATLLGNGEVALILDAKQLIAEVLPGKVG